MSLPMLSESLSATIVALEADDDVVEAAEAEAVAEADADAAALRFALSLLSGAFFVLRRCRRLRGFERAPAAAGA